VNRKLVLLDLDGTLVDSAPAILSALRGACVACGVTPLVPLDAALIGPPLRTMIERLVGEKGSPVTARLEEAFRDTYDQTGYLDTIAYPLLHDALRRLRATGHSLALVTNKRRVPTLKILDLFDLAHEFDAVYTVDSFPPDRLTIEITETSLLADRALAALRLTRLRDAGIQIAVDDFGTGYASMDYLTSLPLDALKIDRGLVVDLVAGKRDRIVVRAMIGLARELDLKVVAEGVETPEQLAILAECGCDYYQGFLGAGPLDEQQLADFVTAA